METILNKLPHINISEKAREIIFDVVTYLFVLLFVYTAYSKLTDIEIFINALKKFPFLKDYNVIVAYAIPIIELLFSTLLIIPFTKRLGLKASLVLMILFTAYLIAMIIYTPDLPCYCGGVVSKMTWKEHILFNTGFIIIALTGLVLHKKN